MTSSVTSSSTGSIPANPAPDPNLSSGVLTSGTSSQSVDSIVNSILSNASKPISTTIPALTSDIVNFLNNKGVSVNPEPNSLDAFANYTYHIKLSFTGDQYSYNLDDSIDYQSVPKEVIAESGVTAGFNIRDFEFKNLCAPQDRIGIMKYTTWKMTIAEPYGLSLVDRLYTLSKSIGISNHLMCPYFIEIWFNGYNEDGTIADLQTPYYKVFRCIIRNISMDATDGGTVYNLEGTFDGSLGAANEFAMLPNNVTINNATTLGEFFDQLASTMNTQMKNLQYDSKRRIEYIFNIKPEWRTWKLTRRSSDPSRTSGFNESGPPTKPSVTFPGGTDISQMLLTVMSMTEEGQRYTLGPSISSGSTTSTTTGTTTSASVQNSNNRANTTNGVQGTNQIPFIYPEIKLIGYNYNIGDYVRQITYHFLDYTTVRGFMDRQAVQNAQQPSVQLARLQNFSAKGNLRKIYNFIFTGENVDVLKFDLKLENYWTAVQPAHDGENTGSNYSLAPQVPGQSVPVGILSQYRSALADVSAAKSTLQQLLDVQSSSSSNKPASLEANIAAARIDLQNKEKILNQFTKVLDQTSFEIVFPTQSPGQKALSGIIVNNPDLLNDPAIRADVAIRNAYNLSSARWRKDRYLEDIAPTPPSENPLPISIFTTNVPLTQNNSVGGESKADPTPTTNTNSFPRSRGLLAAVIHNVTTGGAFFAQIQLEIRGDPYWMGVDNIQNNNMVRKLINGSNIPGLITTPTQTVDALFENGESAFLLFFRTGEQPNENSGFVEFNQSSWAFNGMYVVTEVTNILKDGKFTQILDAKKDVAMYSILNTLPSSPSQITTASVSNPVNTVASPGASSSSIISPGFLQGLAQTSGF